MDAKNFALLAEIAKEKGMLEEADVLLKLSDLESQEWGCGVDVEVEGRVYPDCVLDNGGGGESCMYADGLESKWRCPFWIPNFQVFQEDSK